MSAPAIQSERIWWLIDNQQMIFDCYFRQVVLQGSQLRDIGGAIRFISHMTNKEWDEAYEMAMEVIAY